MFRAASATARKGMRVHDMRRINWVRRYGSRDIKSGMEPRAMTTEQLRDAVEGVNGPQGLPMATEEIFGSSNITRDGVTTAKRTGFNRNGTTCTTIFTKAKFTNVSKSVAGVMNAMDSHRGIDRTGDAVVQPLNTRAKVMSSAGKNAQVACVTQWHAATQLYQLTRFGVPFRNVSAQSQGQVQWLQISPCQTSVRFFATGQDEKAEVTVPFMGESVSDGAIASFLKKPGDRVEVDDVIAQIDTDKVTIDVRSTAAGFLEKLTVKEGDTVSPGVVVAVVAKGDSAMSSGTKKEQDTPAVAPDSKQPDKASMAPPEARIKTDKKDAEAAAPDAAPPPPPLPPSSKKALTQATELQLPAKDREHRVPMTRLRKRVAARLKDSQNTFALLTTFNEIDMTNLLELRSQYNEKFQEKHGMKLGFMSCFVKAAVSALQQQPVVNAVIDGDDIIYRDYIDISIAVGTKKGLVVPVIRGAEKQNFAEIEKTINDLAVKANNGSISIDEMAGGTFTISNGGVYGSLLSTPIINPPQSAILGMHTIQKRPMVVKDSIVARPMMYIALTYDHRLIDGREAVYFLRCVKDVVEDPRRLLLDV